MRRAIFFFFGLALCSATVGATTGEGGSDLADEAGEEPGPGGQCPAGTVKKCRCRHEGECEPDTGETCECVSTVGACAVYLPGAR